MKRILNTVWSLILLSVFVIGGCAEKQQMTVAVKHCYNDRWDTVTIKCYPPIAIDAFKTGVPLLKDAWGGIQVINVCEFKILKSN